MKPIAAIAAALVLGACAFTTTHPAAPAGTTSPSPAVAPSIDCTKTTNKAQQLVCDDPQLGGLDRGLQDSYRRALARPGADTAALTAEENAWATQRDACAQNADMRTCVLEAYQTRLDELAIADPSTVTPPVVTYRCPAADGLLTAQFYNQFSPPAAVVNWKGNQQILFQQLSGSGARYGRQGIEYWEHHGEVRLDFNGTKIVCNAP